MKKMLTLRVISVLAAMLLLLLAFSVVYAHGHTADQLDKAGWACGPAGPHDWIHCFPPAARGNPSTIQVKVFGVEGHPFLGTEILIHKDRYNGQPCMTDGGGPYEPLFPDPPNIPYYACHHFDTDH